MSENTSIIPEDRGKPVPPALYALLSNALQVYGVLALGWHFFPILYLWWWEELILSIFGILKLRRWRPVFLQSQSEQEVVQGEKAAQSRFFLLFIYLIFIVVMAGFMFAPHESYIENVITLAFGNKVFNLNLLLFVGLQIWVFWREDYGNQKADPAVIGALRSTFDLRSSVIHIGLLLGALLSFLIQKYAWFKTEHAFMFGFMAVKTLIELWAAFKPGRLWNSSSS